MTKTAPSFLAGGGEMAAMMRAHDWSATPLGPPETWPQRLKSIVNVVLTSRFAMWMGWGAELTFFYNDAYAPTLGVKHSWALGRPSHEVWAEIWQDIGPRIEHVLATGEATWDEALMLFLERSGYAEETYHTFSYSPLQDDDGRIVGNFCVVTEDTERVIGERRLRTLREMSGALAGASGEAAVIAAIEAGLASNSHDLPFSLLYFWEGNAPATLAAATGFASLEDAAMRVASAELVWREAELLAGAPHIMVSLGAARVLPAGMWRTQPTMAVVLPVARRGQDGVAGFLVLGLNPHRRFDDAYADFAALLAGQIASGLANARSYEEERRRAEALAELDRAKTDFFSNISHEFRTPLTLMLGPLEELRAGEASAATTAALLETAHHNAIRLLKLVNALLDISRLESGRSRASYEPVDLAAVTADLASTFRSAIERAGLRLVVDTPKLAQPVFVDRDMWEKIVLNLISNAFKFTFAGEIGVTLRPSADGRGVGLTVHDTGIGIPEAELPHLFERFHRIPGAPGRSIEGSGIGLSMVRELTRLHGGRVDVASRQGEGTRFTVSLRLGSSHLPADQLVSSSASPGAPPAGRAGAVSERIATPARAASFVEEALRWLDPVDAPIGALTGALTGAPADAPVGAPADAPVDAPVGAPVAPSAGAPSIPPPDPARMGGGRILLADDNADMRAYVVRLLGDAGFAVEAVRDGEAALASARTARPDLVLSDVMMPRLDGFGLLAALRADPALRSLPVILLSARAGEDARIEGVEAGADDYLVKPFNARELLVRVEGSLRLARLRQRSEERILAQKRILEMIAVAAPLDDVLDAIARFVDAEATGACTIIIPITPDGRRLGRGRGPSFPASLRDAVLGLPVGLPYPCPCSEAADRIVPITVPDIAVDRRFPPAWREAVLAAGLRAVRSTPATGPDGRTVATVSIFYAESRAALTADAEIIAIATHLASIAIRGNRDALELRESAARLRRAQRAGRIADWTWDLPSGAIDLAGETEAVYGIPAAALPATADEFFQRVPEEARQKMIDSLAPLLSGEAARYDFEFPFRDGDGAVRWLASKAETVASDEDGRALKVVGVNYDVTARRQTETALRDLTATLEQRVAEAIAERKLLADIVEGTDAFVQVMSPSLHWLAINQAGAEEFARLHGVRARPGTALPVLLAGQPGALATLASLWNRALGGEEFTETVAFLGIDGQTVHQEMKFNRLRDGRGVAIGAYHFARDVSRRLADEARLAEAQAQLHEMQKLETIGQLTGGVAHDFNNLLTPIYGALDLLQRRYAHDDRAARMIAGAMQASDRARLLVGRLLSFARRQHLETRPVAIPELVRGMADLIERSLGPLIEVQLDLPDSLPPANVDPNQLELGLLNLCVNARDAMPGGGTLRISADRKEVGPADQKDLKPGRYLRLCVIDSGIGMEPETLRRAIEPFYTTKGIGKGTGLGLSMVHGLAAQSGGVLHLLSAPGEGTTATIYLPITEQREAADPPATGGLESQDRGRRLRLLLVDDEEVVRMGLADMLADLGHLVLEAASGDDALSLLGTGPPVDLLITDYMMPGMTGAALIQAARRLQPGLRAILITGFAFTDAVGPSDVPRLGKPFRESELVALMAATLGESLGRPLGMAVSEEEQPST